MQDRFKFRAYFISEEYYVKITQLNVDEEGNITKMKFIKPKKVDPEGGVYTCYQDQLNKFVFEQCTGLRDKNGKPIYEGDIVKLRLSYDENLSVEYSEGSFNLVGNYGFRTLLRIYKNDCEIVGNIHENSELLEDNK